MTSTYAPAYHDENVYAWIEQYLSNGSYLRDYPTLTHPLHLAERRSEAVQFIDDAVWR